MEKIWLKHYPPGMPAEVDVNEFSSLCDVLRHSCQRFAALPAYRNMGVAMTYDELDCYSRDFAAYLQSGLRLRKGERVAVMMPNLLQYPVVLFGIWRAGLVVVNVNPQYTAPELYDQLQDSGAVAIVVLENFAHTLQQVLDQHPAMQLAVMTTEVGDRFPVLKEMLTNVVVKFVKKLVPPWDIPDATEFNAVLREGRELLQEDVTLTHQDLALLQYTGGTTGVAKGAMLTHGNMVANVLQMAAWVAHDLQEGVETLVCPLPLYHIYALTSTLVFLKIGAQTVLITNPKDLPAMLHDIKACRMSAIIGVNTLYRALLDNPGFAQVDTRHLKVANAGGMAVQRVVAERWKQATGVPIIEAYGLTEASPGAIANPLNIQDWTGCIGMPIPSTEAIILNDGGRPLPVGEVGEICVRGPQVMAGYWNHVDESTKAFTSDGWLRTGDMGFMDEQGCFTLTDRKKDMIIVSGFKVFPNQVEDVVAMHPGVAEVAAIGVPDARTGEAVKLIVVRQDPALTEPDLLTHCRSQLTDYKLPKTIEFRTEPLPKSILGKILRRQLRDAAVAAQGPMMTDESPH